MNPNSKKRKGRIAEGKNRSSRAFSLSSLAIWYNMNNKEKKITIGAVVALVALSIFLIFIVNDSDAPHEIISRGEQASDEESVSLSEEESEPDVVSVNIREGSSEESLGSTELPGLNESEESSQASSESSTPKPPHQVQVLVQEGSLQEGQTSVIIGSSSETIEEEPEDPIVEPPASSESSEETTEPGSEEDPEEISESIADPSEPGSESGEGSESGQEPGEGSEQTGDASGEEGSETGDASSDDGASGEGSEVASGDTSSDDLTESEPVESADEPKTPPSGILAEMISAIPTYQQQNLGANPVYYYDHPVLDIGFDLREDHAMARDMYVLPTTNGFYILQRQMILIANLDLDDLIQQIETQGIEGASSVQVMSADQREAVLAANPDAVIMNYKDNQIIAIQQVPVKDSKVNQVFNNFADQVVDANFIASHISTVPLEENNYEIVDTTDYLAQWKNMLDQYALNPAQAEWDKSLPLYANSSGYVVDGEDKRSIVLSDNPSYTFMMADLTGDGNMEFIVNAKTPGADNAEGYWAIYSSAINGLLLSAESHYGNGDLIQAYEELVATSELDTATGITISFDYFRLPKQQKTVMKIDFLEPEGFMNTMTGREIAEQYPGYYIVQQGAEYYLVDRQNYDTVISEFMNTVDGATILRGVSSAEMKAALSEYEESLLSSAMPAEEVSQLGVSSQTIDDPVSYLAETFGKVPFSRDIWDTAIPVENLQDVDEPITVDYLQGE